MIFAILFCGVFRSSCEWFLFGFLCPTREFFIRMETLPLPVKGCKFWPVLGTHGHWAESVLSRYTECDTGHPLIMVISEDRDTHTYFWAFSSRAVTTCFCDLGILRLGFELPTFRLPGERSSPLQLWYLVSVKFCCSVMHLASCTCITS